MAEVEEQITMLEHYRTLLMHLEDLGYHHAQATTHQAKLYSEILQEITILEKR